MSGQSKRSGDSSAQAVKNATATRTAEQLTAEAYAGRPERVIDHSVTSGVGRRPEPVKLLLLAGDEMAERALGRMGLVISWPVTVPNDVPARRCAT